MGEGRETKRRGGSASLEPKGIEIERNCNQRYYFNYMLRSYVYTSISLAFLLASLLGLLAKFAYENGLPVAVVISFRRIYVYVVVDCRRPTKQIDLFVSTQEQIRSEQNFSSRKRYV